MIQNIKFTGSINRSSRNNNGAKVPERRCQIYDLRDPKVVEGSVCTDLDIADNEAVLNAHIEKMRMEKTAKKPHSSLDSRKPLSPKEREILEKKRKARHRKAMEQAKREADKTSRHERKTAHTKKAVAASAGVLAAGVGASMLLALGATPDAHTPAVQTEPAPYVCESDIIIDDDYQRYINDTLEKFNKGQPGKVMTQEAYEAQQVQKISAVNEILQNNPEVWRAFDSYEIAMRNLSSDMKTDANILVQDNCDKFGLGIENLNILQGCKFYRETGGYMFKNGQFNEDGTPKMIEGSSGDFGVDQATKIFEDQVNGNWNPDGVIRDRKDPIQCLEEGTIGLANYYLMADEDPTTAAAWYNQGPYTEINDYGEFVGTMYNELVKYPEIVEYLNSRDFTLEPGDAGFDDGVPHVGKIWIADDGTKFAQYSSDRNYKLNEDTRFIAPDGMS